jgi:hypothetical protein
LFTFFFRPPLCRGGRGTHRFHRQTELSRFGCFRLPGIGNDFGLQSSLSVLALVSWRQRSSMGAAAATAAVTRVLPGFVSCVLCEQQLAFQLFPRLLRRPQPLLWLCWPFSLSKDASAEQRQSSSLADSAAATAAAAT